VLDRRGEVHGQAEGGKERDAALLQPGILGMGQRNAVLGRPETAAERDYLAGEGAFRG
jgi:hypothetical protein